MSVEPIRRCSAESRLATRCAERVETRCGRVWHDGIAQYILIQQGLQQLTNDTLLDTAVVAPAIQRRKGCGENGVLDDRLRGAGVPPAAVGLGWRHQFRLAQRARTRSMPLRPEQPMVDAVLVERVRARQPDRSPRRAIG